MSKSNDQFCFFPIKTTLSFIRGIIFFEIFMITLVSSSKQPFYTILHTTVEVGQKILVIAKIPWQRCR